jgi:anaerobic selenocysteine-containing dehydrogenase
MSKAAIKPLGESVRDTEMFRMMAKKMGYVETSGDAFTQTDEEMMRDLIDPSNPLMEGMTYEQLEQNGWARASVQSERRNFLKNGWPTPSKKIEILCETLAKDYPDQDPLPTYVPEIEGQEDPLRAKYPIQVLSCASHHFIGDSFQIVPRLQAMQSRPTVELSPEDAAKRGIKDGDFVRLYNDRGETYCYAVIIEGMLSGMCVTQKQYKGSNTPGGVNVNALNTERFTDFGRSPTFYSCLAEVEKVAAGS